MNTTIPVIMPLDRAPAIQNVDAAQGDTGRRIDFYLYSACTPWAPPVGTTAMVHYTKPDGTSGSYDALPDGSSAYTIKGNVLTVALAPQICDDPGTVHLQVSLIQGEAQITTFCTHVRVYSDVEWIDQSQICDPCIFSRISEKNDSQSTIAVTVCNINEAFVTGLFLEYVVRPFNENESVSIPIEIGAFDLINGHIYSVTVPVISGFMHRPILHYTDTDGNAKTLEGRWWRW